MSDDALSNVADVRFVNDPLRYEKPIVAPRSTLPTASSVAVPGIVIATVKRCDTTMLSGTPKKVPTGTLNAKSSPSGGLKPLMADPGAATACRFARMPAAPLTVSPASATAPPAILSVKSAFGLDMSTAMRPTS